MKFVVAVLIFLATTLGGGSLLLFGIFLLRGPLDLVPLVMSPTAALGFDALLSLAFFTQHSGMVRRRCRAALARAIPDYVQPAVYAMTSGVALASVVILWQGPLPTVYRVEGIPRLLLGAALVASIAGFAWAGVALKGVDLLGRGPLKARLKGHALRPAEFVVQGPYHWVRHPFYACTLMLVWSQPQVTADRLLFNALWSVWIVLGAWLEERDLVAQFGNAYRDYQRRVPMLVPWRWRHGS